MYYRWRHCIVYYYSRCKVSGRIDCTAGVVGKADVNGRQPQSDEEGNQTLVDPHVPFVGDGHDDDEEEGRPEDLVKDQGGCADAAVRRVGGKDSGRPGNGGPVVDPHDFVVVNPVENGRGEKGAQVVGQGIDRHLLNKKNRAFFSTTWQFKPLIIVVRSTSSVRKKIVKH